MAFVNVFADDVLGRRTSQTVTGVGTLGTVTGTLSAVHKAGGGLVGYSTFTLTDVLQNVVNGTEYQGTKIWTFPSGIRARVLQAYFSLAQKTTSALATTLNASSTGAMSLGTATASATTLNSTMANLVASTAFTSSATIDVAGTAVSGYFDANNDGSETLVIDTTSSDASIYLNTAYATTTDVDGDATQTLTGTISITWLLSYQASAL